MLATGQEEQLAELGSSSDNCTLASLHYLQHSLRTAARRLSSHSMPFARSPNLAWRYFGRRSGRYLYNPRSSAQVGGWGGDLITSRANGCLRAATQYLTCVKACSKLWCRFHRLLQGKAAIVGWICCLAAQPGAHVLKGEELRDWLSQPRHPAGLHCHLSPGPTLVVSQQHLLFIHIHIVTGEEGELQRSRQGG